MPWNRVFCDAVLFASVLILPWWIPAALSFYFFFIFDSYYEPAFLGLLFDILYGVDTSRFGADKPVIFIATILFYIILNSFKKYLRISS